MKLATLRTGPEQHHGAVQLAAGAYLPLPASDVGALLAVPDWRATGRGSRAHGRKHRRRHASRTPTWPRGAPRRAR